MSPFALKIARTSDPDYALGQPATQTDRHGRRGTATIATSALARPRLGPACEPGLT
eukprot:CAMPEP_0198361630 /NCGR_PEP_ID=MMETSP1450-20131203/142941_1 /TAXON_ID=753684 ORGANISM="Madagascaria erythrocladiodes, Strain CCMP3234" /NCGR_SAMPLE_ID=MMETSP1450 /ASSEMBLY_ACC=CAM_ASM_001115 /LENGTH=55 /DNA_ID=CAMNT_0044068751 /DNA_START=99 /DNA_END=262 /DNA_ORIENTATION=+